MGVLGLVLLLLEFLHAHAGLVDLMFPFFGLGRVVGRTYRETLFGRESDLALVSVAHTDHLGVDGTGDTVEDLHVELGEGIV